MCLVNLPGDDVSHGVIVRNEVHRRTKRQKDKNEKNTKRENEEREKKRMKEKK
jgi:hypothetical protein